MVSNITSWKNVPLLRQEYLSILLMLTCATASQGNEVCMRFKAKEMASHAQHFYDKEVDGSSSSSSSSSKLY